MNISHLNVGIIHSLIGKNDGVSIVIDQTVNAMVKDMGIELGSIYFLAAHSSPRFNAETDEVFWHKNDIHKQILMQFCEPAGEDLDQNIHQHALYARKRIKQWVKKHSIDLIIAHNTSHPYNFITAVGLGYFIEGLRQKGTIWPKVMVWWHDSYFERPQFSNPNQVIQKYLKYIPGTYIDGIAFINNSQPALAKKLFEKYNQEHLEAFFMERACVVPNTSDIPWSWNEKNWNADAFIYPDQDNYNATFFKDIGLLKMLDEKKFTLEDACILLQHTRVVPRKKIETALDFAFRLEKKFTHENNSKCVVLLVSGHSGDEQNAYKEYLYEYYEQCLQNNTGSNVILIFGEDHILSHRDIIVDKKYYKFAEIPSIVAAHGGIGTYFSEIEGFGNNLLEMISLGLPVVINKYEVYKTDIEHFGFDLPAIDNCVLTNDLVDRAYILLTDVYERNSSIFHNLKTIAEKLDHKIIAEILTPMIKKMFTQTLM